MSLLLDYIAGQGMETADSFLNFRTVMLNCTTFAERGMTVFLRCRGSLILSVDHRLMISIIYADRNLPMYFFKL